MSSKTTGSLLAAMAMLVVQPVFAKVIWVDQKNGSDDWNGTCETWQGGKDGPKESFTNLTSYADGDTVYVKPGHYLISKQIEPNRHEISFIGVGRRDEIVLDGENARGIFYCESKTNCWFSNLTMVNAYGTGSNTGSSGSAIRTYGATGMTVSNCVFRHCRNESVSGGAVSLRGSGSTVIDCVFTNCEALAGNAGALFFNGRASHLLRCRFEDCRAAAYGGAVSFTAKADYQAPWPVVEDCQFVSNRAVSAFAYAGGGVFRRCTFVGNVANYGGALGVRYGDVEDKATTVYCLDCQDCSFVGNRALQKGQYNRAGGAAYLYGGDNAIMSNSFTRCVFTDNMATNGEGGAIWGGAWKVADCAFTGNRGTSGGAVYFGSYTPEKVCSFERSAFVGNLATNANSDTYGGAIHGSAMKSGLIRNCLFDGNTARKSGGALLLKNAHVESCTLVRNRSTQNGGAILNDSNSDTVFVTNCVFMGNFSSNGDYRDLGNGNLGRSSGFCCFTDGFYFNQSYNIKTNDPMFVDYAAGDLRLDGKSACVNAGTNLSWMVGATDLRGRRKYGRIAEKRVDIGCYEYWQPLGLLLMVR